MSSDLVNKDNIDMLLNEVAKEYKREYGRHSHIEIVLVGGAAVVAKYHFRYSSEDIDFTTPAASAVKEVANRVGDRLGFPNGWLNNDFTRTESFSYKIYEHSKPYREFAQVLSVRVVADEFLVAMKLKSGRGYKNDLSDVVGILAENRSEGHPITFEKIDHAMTELYGNWIGVPEGIKTFVENATLNDKIEQTYDYVVSQEAENRQTVLNVMNQTSDKSEITELVDTITDQFLEDLNQEIYTECIFSEESGSASGTSAQEKGLIELDMDMFQDMTIDDDGHDKPFWDDFER